MFSCLLCYSFVLTSHFFSASGAVNVSSSEQTVCPPLPSTVITGFIGTMGESDSLQAVYPILDEMLLVWKILLRGLARPPRYAENNNLKLAMLSDPDGTSLFLPFRIKSIACCRGDGISFHLYDLTRLNHFTLSHYGSYGFLPTLKPDLTASAPRLDTGVWLALTRPDFHRLYFQRRTGAPHRFHITVFSSRFLDLPC